MAHNATRVEFLASLSVQCPNCGAVQLQRCKRRKKFPHPERISQARKLFPQLWKEIVLTTSSDYEAETRKLTHPSFIDLNFGDTSLRGSRFYVP